MSGKIGLLERVDLDKVEGEQIAETSTTAWDDVLARVEKLGYIPPSLQKEHAKQRNRTLELEATRRSAQLPLGQVLRNAGIKPFTNGSVGAYQKAMLRGRLQVFDKGLSEGQLGMLWLFFLSCNTILLLSVGLFFISFTGQSIFFLLGAVPIMSLVVCVVLQTARVEIGDFVDACLSYLIAGPFQFLLLLYPPGLEWKSVSFGCYDKDIPRFVLETVAEINSRCPSARFEVEELTQKKDPFLVVVLGAERYHIEVWNEPKYKAKRQK